MYHNRPEMWKELLQIGLKEDGSPWDWTTLGILPQASPILKARVLAKSEGIWAAQSLLGAISGLLPSIKVQSKFSDGDRLRPGDEIVKFAGPPQDLLAVERPFLNLAAYASGIAWTTHQIVEQVKRACPSRSPRVTLTRKTLPAYRDVAIHAVIVGGGHPHRVSLSGGVLIKENHIATAKSLIRAVEGVRVVAPHGLKIEVEVRSLEELKQAIDARADGVLLDNFTPEQVGVALDFLKQVSYRPCVEVSGGLNSTNISQYAMVGVDVLSLGALTHSVQAVDLSFLIYE